MAENEGMVQRIVNESDRVCERAKSECWKE